MSISVESEPILELRTLLEAAPVGDVIRKEMQRSMAQFGKYTEASLRRLRETLEAAARRMDAVVMMRGIRRRADLPISVDETIRLGMMKREIEGIVRDLDGQLSFLPESVRKAGSLGEIAGAKEIELLLKEIPGIGFPGFTLINREAIEFYANYALTTSIDYGVDALAAIKRRLDMAVVTGEAWGPVAKDVRRIMLEKRGLPVAGLHHKVNRIVRTEMVRAYAGGHSAYGRACEFVVGEAVHNQAGACAECIGHSEEEYYYNKRGAPPLPYHPHGECYTTYLFRKNLFTKEELARLEPPEIPWKPSMIEADAIRWARGSVERRTFYHGTEYASEIGKNGFVPSPNGTPTAGIFLSTSKEEAWRYGHDVLGAKVNVRRLIRGDEELRKLKVAWRKARGYSLEESFRHPLEEIAWYRKRGYDGILFRVDEAEDWIILFVKNLVTTISSETRM